MRVLDFVNFKYCPRCGEQRLRSSDAKSFVCLSCGFVYYHGSAAVAVGIIEWDDKIILTKRAREPQKGLLALPGGFVDYEESLESALVRELQEELNLTVTTPIYLCSHWERYPFRDVVYFATIAFYLLGAAILGRTGLNPEKSDLIRTLAVMYEPVFGPQAEHIFLFGAFVEGCAESLFVGVG